MASVVDKAAVEQYNKILDYCIEPKTVREVMSVFNLEYPNAYQKMRYLHLNDFVVKTRPVGGRNPEYLFKTCSNRRMEVIEKTDEDVHKDFKTVKASVIPGARYVSSDQYHTKGNPHKLSSWIGSTADSLF